MNQSAKSNGDSAHDAGTGDDPTPKIVDKSSTYHAPEEAAELLRSDAGDLTATTVTMDRSGAETIIADRVTMDRSGTRKLEAKSAHFENSGAVVMSAENAVFHGGAAIAVKTNDVRISDSHVAALRASEKTTIEGNVFTAIYAGPADEKIKPLLTTAGAASFGAGFAVTLLLIGRTLRRLTQRG